MRGRQRSPTGARTTTRRERAAPRNALTTSLPGRFASEESLVRRSRRATTSPRLSATEHEASRERAKRSSTGPMVQRLGRPATPDFASATTNSTSRFEVLSERFAVQRSNSPGLNTDGEGAVGSSSGCSRVLLTSSRPKRFDSSRRPLLRFSGGLHTHLGQFEVQLCWSRSSNGARISELASTHTTSGGSIERSNTPARTGVAGSYR